MSNRASYLTNSDKVKDFMKAFGQDLPDIPGLPDEETIKLRLKLILEEVEELKEALDRKNMVDVLDGLCDILYVVYGAGHAFGIDLDEPFNHVHHSNMSKLGEDGKPIYREDGKVLKGPNYYAPSLSKYIWEPYERKRNERISEIIKKANTIADSG